jgi:ABC-type Fe3+ transport system permease subunit
VRGTLWRFDRAVYDAGLSSSSPSNRAILAGSILHLVMVMVMVMAKGKESKQRVAIGSKRRRHVTDRYRSSWNLSAREWQITVSMQPQDWMWLC